MTKRALITGVTGQDGSYLAELLLNKDYIVYGLVRRTSAKPNLLPSLENHPHFVVLTGDLTDSCVQRYIAEYQFDEIYNLAAQSFVGASFNCPETTMEINSLGLLNILEGVRASKLQHYTKIYQASTSELFGINPGTACTENTPFYPRSPYGVAKLAAHWLARNYRESYDMFVSCGLLFNHESPRRGIEFVTQKIARHAKFNKEISLGNLDSKRDWGHAKDYVRGMHLMLQHHEPDDFVLATGQVRSVRDFVKAAYKAKTGMNIVWRDSGLNETGWIEGKIKVRVNPKFYRPAEVDYLLGDASKARDVLNWYPQYSFDQLVGEMVR